jgi:hypothetical protein
MEYDKDKVDEMVLALLWLTTSRVGGVTRAWKGLDLETLDRLHERGFIDEASSKSPSLVLTKAGAKRSEELFRQHFGKGA